MGAKRALLVGCNYPGTNAELRGCINDVWGMKKILTEYYGFPESDITIMIDTDPSYPSPTGKNIKAKLSELVATSQDGDLLVFHFSGHGTQIPDRTGDEKDAKDEAICPTDMNVLCDDDLRVLFKPLEAKPGVKLTFIADCCHSGSLLDHAQVPISGPKDGQPPPPALDMGALGAFLSVLGQPTGRDLKNRALPFNDLCGMLSKLLGGAPVNASNVRGQMGSIFGADASAKIQQFMKIAQMLDGNGTLTKMIGGMGGAGGAGGAMGGMGGAAAGAGAAGGAAGLLGMLCACLAPQANNNTAAGAGNAGYAGGAGAGGYAAAPAAGAGGYAAAAPSSTPAPAEAAQGPAAHYAVPSVPGQGGNLAEPQLNVVLPPAGAKPAEGLLKGDIGVLITGCQSAETSADACPSGDPSKAHGALSNAIQTVLAQHKAQFPGQQITYRNLVIGVRELLAKTGFTQNPCLECSERNADSPFIAL